MGLAWETTEEDVFAVLKAHGAADDIDHPQVAAAHQVVLTEAHRIEHAALHYTDMEAQAHSALDEIENVLIEEGMLSSPKKFVAPA